MYMSTTRTILKSLLATISSLLMLAAASTVHAQPFAYITNQSSGTVSVINTATNNVIGSVVVGSRDHAEIWTPVRWDDYRRAMESPEALAEHLSGLGI